MTLSGIPPDAWERGVDTAKAGHVPSIGADDHILAACPGPPWIEPRWPPRREPRTITLHGGPYDACRLNVYALGQHLTVGGEHGPALYEYKEHDTSTAAYTATGEDDIERRPVDRREATTAGRSEGRGPTGSGRAGADRSDLSRPRLPL